MLHHFSFSLLKRRLLNDFSPSSSTRGLRIFPLMSRDGCVLRGVIDFLPLAASSFDSLCHDNSDAWRVACHFGPERRVEPSALSICFNFHPSSKSSSPSSIQSFSLPTALPSLCSFVQLHPDFRLHTLLSATLPLLAPIVLHNHEDPRAFP